MRACTRECVRVCVTGCLYLSNEEGHLVAIELVSHIAFDVDESHFGVTCAALFKRPNAPNAVRSPES